MSWLVYVPTWILTAGSLLVAVLAYLRSKATDERSVKADEAAAEARAGAASVEVSLDRMAKAMEAQAQRAAPTVQSNGQWEAHGTAPVPPKQGVAVATSGSHASVASAFNIEYVNGDAYRLRNVSTSPMTNVRTSIADVSKTLTRRLPTGVNLAPFASTDTFVVVPTSGGVGEIMVICDQVPDGVLVALPPKR